MLNRDNPGRKAAAYIRKTLNQTTIVKQIHFNTDTDPDDLNDQLERLAKLPFP